MRKDIGTRKLWYVNIWYDGRKDEDLSMFFNTYEEAANQVELIAGKTGYAGRIDEYGIHLIERGSKVHPLCDLIV